MSDTYQSGVCNIGRAEIAQRKKIAFAGFLSAAIFAILISISGSHSLLRLAIFIPLVIGSVGFLQARKRFCLAYGLLGVYNFDVLGRNQKVEDAAARAVDRKFANVIILQSVALAAVITAVFIAL